MTTPVLLLDSAEAWRPVEVETITRKSVIVRKNGNASPLLDVAQLTDEIACIDFPSNMTQPKDSKPVGYHRASHHVNLWWHQFWTFWLYNPKSYVGQGAHEGDWECVQVVTIDEAGDQPVYVTCSQHHSGEKREYWRCKLDSAQRPIVYVAEGSHANYFAPVRDAIDAADGNGPWLSDIEWREFPETGWPYWTGKWGHSDSSPPSPARQAKWGQPHVFHGLARAS